MRFANSNSNNLVVASTRFGPHFMLAEVTIAWNQASLLTCRVHRKSYGLQGTWAS